MAALQVRFSRSMYLVSIFGIAMLYPLSVLVFTLVGNAALVAAGVSTLVALFWQIPVLYPIILVIGGPLGEEIGWRGFVLPRFLKQTTPLMAGLECGILWAVWHLPLFWLPGSSQTGMPLPLFVLEVLAVSVIFTWIYLRSSRSLLAILLAHTSFNVAGYLVSVAYPGLQESVPFNLTLTLVLTVCALVLIATDPQVWRSGGGVRTNQG